MSASVPPLSREVARQVLTKTLRVERGDNVTIESWSEAVPWAVPFVAEARRLGAHPMMLYEDEPAFWEALKSGGARTTGEVGEHEWSALAETDAYVFFYGPSNWPRLDRFSERQLAGMAAYNPEWYARAAKAKVRGVRMYLGRSSAEAAEFWKLDLGRWRASLQRASLESPEKMHALGDRIGRRLQRGKEVHVTHANGTDLTFRLGGYPVQLDDALVDARDVKAGNNLATIPGGVVGVATDHTTAEGTAVGNHLVYPDSGTASGIRWSFRDGHLTDYAYRQGGAGFAKEYRAAPAKGRDRMSYVSIGLNPSLHECPQMEDQELGAVMLRIGGNVFSGGKNAVPYGSWLVLTGADVSVDGRPLLRRGKIL